MLQRNKKYTMTDSTKEIELKKIEQQLKFIRENYQNKSWLVKSTGMSKVGAFFLKHLLASSWRVPGMISLTLYSTLVSVMLAHSFSFGIIALVGVLASYTFVFWPWLICHFLRLSAQKDYESLFKQHFHSDIHLVIKSILCTSSLSAHLSNNLVKKLTHLLGLQEKSTNELANQKNENITIPLTTSIVNSAESLSVAENPSLSQISEELRGQCFVEYRQEWHKYKRQVAIPPIAPSLDEQVFKKLQDIVDFEKSKLDTSTLGLSVKQIQDFSQELVNRYYYDSADANQVSKRSLPSGTAKLYASK